MCDSMCIHKGRSHTQLRRCTSLNISLLSARPDFIDKENQHCLCTGRKLAKTTPRGTTTAVGSHKMLFCVPLFYTDLEKCILFLSASFFYILNLRKLYSIPCVRLLLHLTFEMYRIQFQSPIDKTLRRKPSKVTSWHLRPLKT